MAQVIGTPAEGMKDKPVIVRLSKLTEGIGIVFSGVLTMLEALDAASAKRLIDTMKLEDGSDDTGNPTANDTGKERMDGDKLTESGDIDAVEAVSDGSPAVGVAAGKVRVETPAEREETVAPTAPNAPAITVDDITRIIVQKIKMNRSNNEKIGAILKAYGVTKVSDLPETKYEAFLTDLSQI